MELASQVEIENELKSLGAEQLRFERSEITKQLKQIQENIGDLAFNNYRTYAAAGRTTQDCTEIFMEMNEKLREVSGDISSLQTELKSFQGNSKMVSTELELLKAAADKASPLWEMLALPSRMDLCIRSGYYEAAYSLTNYGMLMQQHSMVKNPLLKNIADRLVEARSLLLEELFNKFSGPMDLASSLQVVNNVRKMPYLTPTQLRVSILQHKDIYLEKQLMDISSHADFSIAAIDIYRTCMHDTLVLYLSVFPENESVKRDSSVDPRWEQWPPSAPSAVLGQWASRNIHRLLDLIHRAEMKSGVDMASVWSKMMSVATTFGRMGLDFRPLIVQSLTSLVLDRFKASVRKTTARLVNDVKVLSIFTGEVSTFNDNGTTQLGSAPVPSPEISMWDDICVYANDVLTALNGMRYSHSPMLLPTVTSTLKDSLISVLSWLSSFHSSPHFPRAVRIICLHLAPFLSNCVRFLFPFDIVSRLFGTSISRQQFNSFTELAPKDLAAACDGCEYIEEILLPLLRKKSLSQIDVDAVLKKPEIIKEVIPENSMEPDQPIEDTEAVSQSNINVEDATHDLMNDIITSSDAATIPVLQEDPVYAQEGAQEEDDALTDKPFVEVVPPNTEINNSSNTEISNDGVSNGEREHDTAHTAVEPAWSSIPLSSPVQQEEENEGWGENNDEWDWEDKSGKKE